ncbi:ADP-ribosylation factor-like protein 3 [Lineus longissimus]|uniref:ADP-ribosylation factor-like protein 3 n=1 Tax=Lineus longissimus TaxID=88925 RepID=UPI00315D4707
MAASSWREASSWQKSGIILVGGAAVAALAWCSYKRYTSNAYQDLPVDEGFDENSKLVDDLPEKRLLVLGLDNVGKSSFLSCMGGKDLTAKPNPTEGFNVVCVQTEKISFNTWEIGGSEKVRQYWTNFVDDTDVLVFIVDSSDRDRLEEAAGELMNLLSDKRLHHVPAVILANKQDIPDALSPTQVLEGLCLSEATIKKHKIHVVGTQVPWDGKKKGVKEAEHFIFNAIHR